MIVTPLYAQSDDTQRAVRLIEQRCAKCHSGEVVNAGIDFSELRDELDVWKFRQTYVKTLDMLRFEKMPPETEPALPRGMRTFLGDWLEDTLANVDIIRIPHDPGFLPPRRLTRHEYRYTVHDLFGIDSLPEDVLPADQVIGDAFDNDASTLTIESLWFERALNAASETVRAVWADPRALERLLFLRPSPPPIEELALYVTTAEESLTLDMGDGDFTVLAHLDGEPGHIFTKAPPGAGFTRGSKQLSFTEDSLTYQIRNGKEIEIEDISVADGEEHWIALSVEDERASLYLDGRLLARVANFSKPDIEGHLFKVGMPSGESRREEEGEVNHPGLIDLKFFSDALPAEDLIEITGGDFEDALPLHAFHWHAGMETPEDESFVTPDGAASAVLERFLEKAFRRPPSEDEFERYIGLCREGIESGFPFEIAMQLPITAALSSPSFLMRSESTRDSEDAYALSSVDMATRLSYFLWSSAPDEELLEAGKSGRLLDNEELLRQTNRMLVNPKAHRFFERFVVQWLRTEGLGDTYRPDADRFPNVNDSLMAAMRAEGVMVFGDAVRENRPIVELLDADTTFMNAELAAHYGYEIEGEGWRRVDLADASRGGLLTQAAVLTVSSSPRRTSPVFRGKWLLDVLLGEPPPPPPPNVPELSADAETDASSLRDLLAAHREQAACAACHDRIDPYGLALEQYDAVGRIRAEDQDTTTTLFSGEAIDGAEELKQFLVERKSEAFIRHLTKKMLAYALSRELKFPDERAVQTILVRLAKNENRTATLIREVVLSEPFRYRLNP